MPTWERFEVLVDGSVESKRPGVWLCFLEWPFVKGLAVRAAADAMWVLTLRSWFLPSLAPPPPMEPAGPPGVVPDRWAVGREKFCRLAVLELAWEVNWAYIGVAEEGAVGALGAWLRGLTKCIARFSSLLEESARAGGRGRCCGGGALEEEAVEPGRGLKLPGARGGGRAGCIVVDVLGVCYILGELGRFEIGRPSKVCLLNCCRQQGWWVVVLVVRLLVGEVR